jgi:quercetin dioxygenase-like cupin family protein
MSQHCISWNDIPEEVSSSGVGKRVLRGEGVSLVMVRVPAGTRADRHSHPHEDESGKYLLHGFSSLR